MICPSCRVDNVEGSQFCGSCGASLDTLARAMPATLGLAARIARLGAIIVDFLVYVVPILAVLFINPVLAVLVFVVIFIYQMVILTKDGQTLAKKALKIRIVKVDTGLNGGFVSNVLLRVVLNGVLGYIPLYALVDILFIFRQDRRCIHDMIAGTRVVDV